MATYAFTVFNTFYADVANKVHNLGSDVLKIMLVNSPAPTLGNTIKANLTEITAANGYSAGGVQATIASSLQTNGLYKLIPTANVNFVASGGSFGPFQYAVLYNSTASGGPLIGWFDFSAPITNVDQFIIKLDAVNGVIQLI